MSPAKEPVSIQPMPVNDYLARTAEVQATGPSAAAVMRPGVLGAGGVTSPTMIRHLQHTIGNRAVSSTLRRMPGPQPIQRALPDAATYTALDAADVLLVAVGTAVASYNAIAASRSTAEGLQTCFSRLQGVDRAIHAWFATVSAAHQRLQGNPHSGSIKELMGLAEQEHHALVTASKTFATVLPMDTTGLEGEELGQLRTLWQDIVNNRGKIKLIGSAGYNQRILSELGKIMATPTGRAMLRFLNMPADGEIPDSAAAALTNIYIGDEISKLSGAVKSASPAVKETEVSQAQALNVKEKTPSSKRKPGEVEPGTEEALAGVQVSEIVPGSEPDPEEFPPVTAETLPTVRTAAWGNKRGFTHAGKKYTFNTGTGSFVTSLTGASIAPARGSGNEILSPGFVTLGHELGHAANMKAGATTLNQTALTSSLAGDDAQAEKWDNAEELLNIENVENPIRSESGLTAREGHRPPAWLQATATQIRNDLKRPLEELYQADRTWGKDAEWDLLQAKCRKLKPQQTLDDGLVQGLRDKVAGFAASRTAQLLPGYLLRISNDKPKADILLAALPDLPTQLQALAYLRNNEAKFPQIKAFLHMNFLKRRVSNKSEREEARKELFLELVEGRRVVA